jgi:hypothetical protein
LKCQVTGSLERPAAEPALGAALVCALELVPSLKRQGGISILL